MEKEKYYVSILDVIAVLTDVCDIKEMFRINESVSSENAVPFKQWLSKFCNERIDETFEPSITMQSEIDVRISHNYLTS